MTLLANIEEENKILKSELASIKQSYQQILN